MIRVEQLHKSYGGVPAVRGIGFSIEAGEVVGFLGPNGAGKSTTMKLLCGLLAPDRGTLEVAGQRLPQAAQRARACLGYLPETTPLYRGMRVDRFLAFCGRLKGLSGKPLRSAIERVAAECSIEARLGQRIEELSKGFRQRVGLAQALIADPPVLILDEPTSGLDPLEVERLRALIRQLGRTKTVLLSTHVLHEVEALCSRALILYAGRLLADGPLEGLLAGSGLRVAFERGKDPSLLERDWALWLASLPGAGSIQGLPSRPGEPLCFAVETKQRSRFVEALNRAVGAGELSLLALEPERRTLESVFQQHTAAALVADRALETQNSGASREGLR